MSDPKAYYPASEQPPSYPKPPVQNAPYAAPAQQIPLSTAAQVGEQYRAELMAQCATGHHDRTKKYGVCGIITAVVLFPIGLICLFMDTEERCARCGIRLNK